MRQARWAQRLGYFAATIALIAVLVACGSGNSYTYVYTSLSDGSIQGTVLKADTTPAAGILVTASPASNSSPAAVTTAADGTYELRAPAGEVTLTFTAIGVQTTTLTVTVYENLVTTASDVTVTAAP